MFRKAVYPGTDGCALAKDEDNPTSSSREGSWANGLMSEPVSSFVKVRLIIEHILGDKIMHLKYFLGKDLGQSLMHLISN